MRRLLINEIPKPGKKAWLSEAESKHAISVLRLQDGESVEIIDGCGGSAIAKLRIECQQAYVEDAQSNDLRNNSRDKRLPVVLELAILKGQAMEWAVEKTTELGVERLTPIITDHGVVKLDRKGPEAFISRWRKISDQALKQCGRLEKLDISGPLTPLELVKQGDSADIKLWCDEKAGNGAPHILDALAENIQKQKRVPAIRLLIGPEGGWSEKERAILSSRYQAVSLGPLVLRAETAVLFAASATVALLRARILDNLTSAKEL